MTFTAIDFETATKHHICAVGIVSVENGVIVDEYYTLIQPPYNQYDWRTIQVHGINPEDTMYAPTFEQVYPEIKKRLANRIIVAHNESFDRNVLIKTMSDYNLDYSELKLSKMWNCTMKIYRKKGFKPASLNLCCQAENIALNHHEALSDARASALLFLKHYNEKDTQHGQLSFGFW
jgi:DNA polymerase-3 subunit epsilon